MEERNDQELVKKAQENPEEFAKLYEKYFKKVYDYFWYRLDHQREIAEDFMQDTFIKAFKALTGFTDRGFSYFTYLTTIAHNTLINHYRIQKTVPLEEAQDIPIDSIGPLEKKIDTQVLWEVISKLPTPEQEVLDMMYKKQLSVKEISEQLGKSENAVKLIASRARKKLAQNPHIVDLMSR